MMFFSLNIPSSEILLGGYIDVWLRTLTLTIRWDIVAARLHVATSLFLKPLCCLAVLPRSVWNWRFSNRPCFFHTFHWLRTVPICFTEISRQGPGAPWPEACHIWSNLWHLGRGWSDGWFVPRLETFQRVHAENVKLCYQWEFQDPKMEVPTIYKAYIRPI